MNDILIVGASIAGLTTAYWLSRYGFSVTLVEINSSLRKGGQAVDIRGTAIEVLERMDIKKEVLNFKTDHLGVNIVDAEGKEIFRSEEFTFTGSRFDSGDVEILRDDLVDILASVTLGYPNITLRYNDTVEDIVSHARGVTVKFLSGLQQDFWAVIGADGIASRVREMIFPGGTDLVLVDNKRFAIWSVSNFLNLERWQTFFRPTEDIEVGVFTARHDHELRIWMRFPEPDKHIRDLNDWKYYVKNLLLEYPGWINSDLAKSLDNCTDFYSDISLQVHLPSWYRNRIVLVGDAAYCASPASGQGTSMALVGAYVLAGEIALHAQHNPEYAFEEYQDEIQEYIEKNQKLAFMPSDVRFSKDRKNAEEWKTYVLGYDLKDYLQKYTSSC